MVEVTSIVSAYYAEKYLKGRLDNLLGQTLRPQIVVVCDKHSVEYAIALQYKSDIDILVTDNVPTIGRAWNIGIEHARGLYITNSNSDDRLFPWGIELLAEHINKSGASIVYGYTDITRTINGEVVGRYTWKRGNFNDLRKGCFLGPMPMWRKMLHERYGMFDETLRVACDYDFWLRVVSQGEPIELLPQVVGTYIARRSSLEHSKQVYTVWESARVRARYHDDNSGYLPKETNDTENSEVHENSNGFYPPDGILPHAPSVPIKAS